MNCIHMLPQLRELEQTFAAELVVIGVHSPKYPAEQADHNLRQAIIRNEIHHPVVNDAGFAIWQSYAVRAWPTLMFIDPRGRVLGKHEGEFPLDAVRSILHEMVLQFDAEGLLDRTPLALTPETQPTTSLRYPAGVALHGDRFAIADTGNHRVVLARRDGTVEQVVGSGAQGLADGSAADAQFRFPQNLSFSPDGATLYVADTLNHALRAVDPASGAVRTVAGTGERAHAYASGPGPQTALASPWGLAFRDGQLWIGMAGAHQLWRFDPASGEIGPAAGTGAEAIHDGPLLEAVFAQPSGLTAHDGQLYLADSETSAVRRIDPAADRVRRLVGRGLHEFGDIDARGDSVRLQHPLAVAATEEEGDVAVYLADSYNDKIKRLDPATRVVETIAGGAGHGLVDGEGDDAAFWEPSGLALDGRTLWVADTNNHAIRAVDLDTRRVTTLSLRGLG